jgi:hypothetical protein
VTTLVSVYLRPHSHSPTRQGRHLAYMIFADVGVLVSGLARAVDVDEVLPLFFERRIRLGCA